jgi:hypothetical protein
VLHAFQKKSKKGIATPHKEIEFDVAALLTGFDEAGRLKSALDLAIRLGLKPTPVQLLAASGFRTAWAQVRDADFPSKGHRQDVHINGLGVLRQT